jgi:poly(3-hydroxybutyrate) depolymerase
VRAVGILSLVVACESASVDPKDLRGVFDSSSASGSAVRSASAPALSASATASATAALPREPIDTQCVTPKGSARVPERVEGRPACRGAEVLEWRDERGDPRYACVYAPSDVLSRAPLPLILYFHGTGPGLDDPGSVVKLTSLKELASTSLLGGDKPGFVLLGLQGRKLGEPVNTFDVEHVAEDNLDVRAADVFIARLSARGLVDPRRVYAVGVGEGGTFAMTYAALRPARVAATAVFAPLEPQARWECPTPPPPSWVLYRACDAIATCESVESWAGKGPLDQLVRVGDDAKAEPACATRNKCTPKRATANHHRFPKGREKDLLAFLAKHELRVK